jgi:hypothetical protein
MTRPPTAAEALFPHLKSGTPDVVQQRRRGAVADAMYPHLKPPPPKPPKLIRESTELSLAQRCNENPQLEALMAMSGIIRRR